MLPSRVSWLVLACGVGGVFLSSTGNNGYLNEQRYAPEA